MATKITIPELKNIIDWTIDSGLHQPILALGAPGVGKSECIKQVIEQRTKSKNEKWKIVDLRLAQMSEVEIAGLIFPTDDKKNTQWLLPNWFPKKTDTHRTLLLLDELTSATKRVQVAAYQLVLDRRLGTSPDGILPDDTVIVALGNRADDNGVVVELAAPLANRFEIYEVEIDADAWIEDYAQVYVNEKTGKGVNPLVTTFIQSHKSKLHTQTEDAEEMVFASPRTWNRVSDILNILPDGYDISKVRRPGEDGYVLWKIVHNKISACIGEQLKAEFIATCNFVEADKIVNKVLAGDTQAEVPKSEKDMLYITQSLISSFMGVASNSNRREEAIDLYNNISAYVVRLKKEYQNMVDTAISRKHQDIITEALNKNLNPFKEQVVRNSKFDNDLKRLDGQEVSEDDDLKISDLDDMHIHIF